MSRRTLVPALALTQTVGYGVLYYAFAVLVSPLAQDLHASTAAVTGAVAVSVLAAAAVAVPVGRWLDRHGGRGLMTAGSVVGVAGVLAWSQVQQLWQLYVVFPVIGVAVAMSLYEAAFAVVIATTPPARRTRALLAITVVAGFASSIFFPLTAVLLAHLGWRHTLLALAGLLALVAIPVHALVVPRQARRGAHRGDDRTGEPGLVGQVLRERRFWQVTGAFVVHASANSSLGILLITYLIRSGHPPTTAATLAGLLGVLSVTGRVLATGVADRVGMPAVVCGVFAVQAAGVMALPWLGRSTTGAAICVAAYGLGFGVSTIARPAILAETYGTRRYATIAATMAVPVTTAMAFAPLGAAALPPDVFVTAAGGLCLSGAVLLGWALHPLRRVEAVRPGAPA